ncbi:MAG TPA: hypothetical protein VFD58_15095 [Blastocatellia bacterium]|nr:hypothetical protein [Blastocatellia bacterium]
MIQVFRHSEGGLLASDVALMDTGVPEIHHNCFRDFSINRAGSEIKETLSCVVLIFSFAAGLSINPVIRGRQE